MGKSHIIAAGKPRHIHGWKADRPDHRDVVDNTMLKAAHLPDHTDLRSYCSPVEDQGELGSCTANAGTSAMELLAIKMGKPRINYSRLFLYYAERVKIENGDPNDDSGAQIRDTMKSLATFGCCAETTWPYDVAKFGVAPPDPAWIEANNHQILKYVRCIGLTGIKAAIASGSSVVIGFSVPENMESDECAKTGFVKYPTPDEQIVGGHAVHAVGYDDKLTHDGVAGFIIFQNSWSEQWGDKGFGYLPYKFFTTGMASDFWTIRSEEY